MRAFILLSLIGLAIATKTAYVCEVPVTVGDSVTPGTISMSSKDAQYTDFNALVFGDMTVNTGDVEGRTLIGGNFQAAVGYSFGCVITTKGSAKYENELPYSVVVGGDMSMPSGSICPEPQNTVAADEEHGYSGGNFTGETDLAGRVDHAILTSLNAQVATAKAYYMQISSALTATANTAGVTAVIQYNGLYITCDSAAATNIVITVNGADLVGASGTAQISGCNNAATLLINVAGSGDFTMNALDWGTAFTAERVVFNIPGARTVTVLGQVYGSIVAPEATLNSNAVNGQVATIDGMVIFDTISMVRQINRVKCRVHSATPPTPQPPRPCVGIEQNCAGYDQAPYGSFKDFLVVSFGDFHAASGDTEGRLAVKGNAVLSTYSVGYELETYTVDNQLPYSLIVGGDLSFNGGAVYPLGTGFPHPGAKEQIAIGGSFTGSADLSQNVNTVTGLDAWFNAGQACYVALSNSLASQADTVNYTIEYSALSISCNDANSYSNVISLTGAQFSQFTYYTVASSCAFTSDWTINIRGSDNVDLTGGSFPTGGNVIYNVINGAGRTVSVHDVALHGSVLAPEATVNQPSGVIIGKLIAGSVTNSLQVNIPRCEPRPVTVLATILADATAGSNTLELSDGPLNNDNITLPGSTIQNRIVAEDDALAYLNNEIDVNVHAGQTVEYLVNSDSGRPRIANQYPQTQTSSSSVVGVAVASMVLAALLI